MVTSLVPIMYSLARTRVEHGFLIKRHRRRLTGTECTVNRRLRIQFYPATLVPLIVHTVYKRSKSDAWCPEFFPCGISVGVVVVVVVVVIDIALSKTPALDGYNLATYRTGCAPGTL